jgi:N-acetylmuramoyl-L-alanine amidase
MAGALLALAGCATSPVYSNKDHPPDVDLTSPASAPPRVTHPAAAPAPAPATAQAAAPVPALPTAAPAPKPAPPAYAVPSGTWIDLEHWARDNHLGPLANLHSGPTPSFALTTPAGRLSFHTGSQIAQWSGLELRLGFAPQLIDGKPSLHTLDLQKNLLPLLAPPPLERGPRVIVLDPGHGGKDTGTCSATGKAEKDYTLDWARRLQALLEARGWKVFLTRTNDAFLALGDRVDFADAHKADLFVSLHFNTTDGNGHAGVETYCSTPVGMPSSVTRNFEDNQAQAYPNNRFDAQNLVLALRTQREVLSATGATDRGVRRARFMTVLRGQNRPAVLIEGGYLSNAEEARRIDSPEHRQKLAEAVARGLGAKIENGG